jgi:hypothetical protein
MRAKGGVMRADGCVMRAKGSGEQPGWFAGHRIEKELAAATGGLLVSHRATEPPSHRGKGARSSGLDPLCASVPLCEFSVAAGVHYCMPRGRIPALHGVWPAEYGSHTLSA